MNNYTTSQDPALGAFLNQLIEITPEGTDLQEIIEQRLTGNRRTYSQTDAGNAERLADAVRSEFVFNRSLGSRSGWLCFDGQKFVGASLQEIRKRAKKVVREIEEVEWRERSLSGAKLNRMVDLASDELAERADAFDADPMLLNLKNGVVNLRTGAFRERSPKDRFTRVADVAFDADADCPRFRSFMSEILSEDAAEYVQRLFGYCLTGKTSAQSLHQFVGSGANGKSTLLHVVETIMGDYAKALPAGFLTGKRDGSTTPHLDALSGVRLARCSEFGARDWINEGHIKAVTGSGAVSVNPKYRDPYEFEPQFKIVADTNHALQMQGTDTGIRRRLRIVPFDYTIPYDRQQPDFHLVLLEEAPGILNWLLEGLRGVRRDGFKLKICPTVSEATSAYFDEQDPVGEFLRASCTDHPDAKERIRSVYEAFCRYCEGEGIKAMTHPRFKTRASKKRWQAGASSGGSPSERTTTSASS